MAFGSNDPSQLHTMIVGRAKKIMQIIRRNAYGM